MQTLDDIRKAVKGGKPLAKPAAKSSADPLAAIREQVKSGKGKTAPKDPGSVTDRLTRMEAAMKLIVLPLVPMVPSSHPYAQMQLARLVKEFKAL